MWTFDLLGSVVLVLALCTVFLMVFVARAHKSGKDIPLWLGSGLAGMLLGAAALAMSFSMMGYEAFTKEEVREMAAAGLATAQPLTTGTTSGAPTGGVMGAGAMGGGMQAGGGGMGGGGGGGMGRQPSPKMLLGSLVRKLDLLTGDIQIRLNDSQATAVRQKLEELAAVTTMTDEEAKTAHDALLALLDDEQKARQDAVGLPMRRGGGGGGPMGGGGGGPPAADASPFEREDNQKALQNLVTRLGGAPAEKPADEKPADEKPAEAKPSEEPAKP